jgi:glycine/D-amino acid oxidase-like deaminating enzyme
MSKKADYLVAGQGLAGTMLAWFLLKENKKVVVFDIGAPHTSSRVAAGIVHPVTGRRIVKSWMADTFIPFALATYREMEQVLTKRFFYEKDIIEVLKEVREHNDWMARSEEPEMAAYIAASNSASYKHRLHDYPYVVRVLKGGYADLNVMLDSMKDYLAAKGALVNEAIDYNQLKCDDEGIHYKEYAARKIIFCEGYRAMTNPYWQQLPWQPSKGELLVIRCEGLKVEEIINRKIFVLPLGNDLYKAGSTYAWDTLNEIPTSEAREKLEHELGKVLQLKYEVVEHVAGVRPTVKERRPFLGFHAAHRHVGIFNGLGTKGVMAAPWLAHHFAAHLIHSSPLLDQVNINRFS